MTQRGRMVHPADSWWSNVSLAGGGADAPIRNALRKGGDPITGRRWPGCPAIRGAIVLVAQRDRHYVDMVSFSTEKVLSELELWRCGLLS